jgi:uncharacterized protein (TIGR00725 family)
MHTRKRLIGVIGSSVGTPEQLAQARAVGRLIAERGAVLLCGGMTGVMTAAAQGAQEAGGLTIGILPGQNAAESPPNEFIAIPLFTGLREARNYLIACASEGLIAIGGGYGTLSEIALGLRLGKPMVLLNSWQFAMAGEMLEVPTARTPEEAVETLWELLSPDVPSP